jgi:hypothetical protein
VLTDEKLFQGPRQGAGRTSRTAGTLQQGLRMGRPGTPYETADGADHQAGARYAVALGGELGKAGQPFRAAKGGHQVERLVDGTVWVALPAPVARAFPLLTGQRAAHRAWPCLQGWRWPPRARPAPTCPGPDIAGPPAMRAGQLGLGCFEAASAGQAAHTGLEPQHMATVDAGARAAHAPTGARAQAEELTTRRAIGPASGLSVRRPAATA